MEKVDLPIKKDKNDKVSPSKPDFGWVGKMILIIIIIVVVVYASVWTFSKFVLENMSIEKEKEIFGKISLNGKEKVFDKKILGDNLGELEKFDIYIQDDKIQNAYAMIGANIFITKGLLENAKTKEELLFILGHEMTHIKNRDVIRNMTRTMPFTMILEFLGINFGNWTFDSNEIIMNYFSRDAEKKADKGGIEYINSLGLNATCANRFFIEAGHNKSKITEFMASHPVDGDRAKFIEDNAKFKDKECTKFEWKE
ncbi:M48 family metalloprotease [Candidatus Gracilibacteria bacterium]|nr:M48 family metalloprotease [Candidatus Gracilibacteria bacterium]